jgi:hypothetical protein
LTPINTSGDDFGNSPANVNSIDAGAGLAKTLPGVPPIARTGATNLTVLGGATDPFQTVTIGVDGDGSIGISSTNNDGSRTFADYSQLATGSLQGASITIDGVQGAAENNNGSYTLTDQNGVAYALTLATNGSGQLSAGTGAMADFGAFDVSKIALGSTITISTTASDVVSINTQTGAGSLQLGTTAEAFGAGSTVQVNDGVIRVGPSAGAIGTDYVVGSLGQLINTTIGFLGFIDSNVFSTTTTEAGQLETSANNSVGLDTPSGAINNAYITSLQVANIGTLPEGTQPFTADPTGAVAGGAVISTTDARVVDPNINTDGVFNNSPGDIISGYYRPGNQILTPGSNDLTSTLNDTTALSWTTSVANYGSYFNDVQSNAPNYVNTDPLVLDLNGSGISLSNWISNNVYFDTNVVPDLNHPGQVVADGRATSSQVTIGRAIRYLPPARTT